MKQIKTMLTAVVMLLATTAFATDGSKVTARVQAAFQNDFSKAILVNWKTDGDFAFASFQLNGAFIEAAYNNEGDLLGTSRKVDIEQLPMAVSLELSKRYGDYAIDANAVELNFDGQTVYYVNVQNNLQSLKLKYFSNGELSVEKKEVKKQQLKIKS